MWDLLVRVPDGLEPLRQRFEEHVKKSGLDAVAKVAQGTVNAEGKTEAMVRCFPHYCLRVRQLFMEGLQ
jgi:cullin 1